jgi:hypothetical protein
MLPLTPCPLRFPSKCDRRAGRKGSKPAWTTWSRARKGRTYCATKRSEQTVILEVPAVRNPGREVQSVGIATAVAVAEL